MARSARRVVRDSFVGGAILVAPLLLTVVVFKIAFDWTRGFIDPVVQGTQLTQYTANIELAAQLIALALLLGAITLVGFVAHTRAAQHAFGNLGRGVNLIPLVRTVYGGIRDVATALVERSSDYESVVFVEYPRMGVYSVGFVTGESPERAREVAGEPVFNVYFPSAPNPTGGGLQLVPESRMHESDLRVREAIRLFVTTGTSTETDDDAFAEMLGVPDAEEDEAVDEPEGDESGPRGN